MSASNAPTLLFIAPVPSSSVPSSAPAPTAASVSAAPTPTIQHTDTVASIAPTEILSVGAPDDENLIDFHDSVPPHPTSAPGASNKGKERHRNASPGPSFVPTPLTPGTVAARVFLAEAGLCDLLPDEKKLDTKVEVCGGHRGLHSVTQAMAEHIRSSMDSNAMQDSNT
ncbi:hypothetical protein B0H13DRAFT_2305241 [Mycena leptocephala]|nr:hypothetical protein B0H13DRAFT_2305241 [Mycena leptocephala]